MLGVSIVTHQVLDGGHVGRPDVFACVRPEASHADIDEMVEVAGLGLPHMFM